MGALLALPVGLLAAIRRAVEVLVGHPRPPLGLLVCKRLPGRAQEAAAVGRHRVQAARREETAAQAVVVVVAAVHPSTATTPVRAALAAQATPASTLGEVST